MVDLTEFGKIFLILTVNFAADCSKSQSGNNFSNNGSSFSKRMESFFLIKDCIHRILQCPFGLEENGFGLGKKRHFLDGQQKALKFLNYSIIICWNQSNFWINIPFFILEKRHIIVVSLLLLKVSVNKIVKLLGKVMLNIPIYIHSIKIMLTFSGKQIPIKYQGSTILFQLYKKCE